MEGSLSDRSRLFRFTQTEPTDGGKKTFYDYQLAAIQHCATRMAVGLPAILGLDTGLGKTCTVRGILDLVEKEGNLDGGGMVAMVVVPGGLVRQVSAGLARYPWEKRDSRTVHKIETGVHATKILNTDKGALVGAVLVVNRALSHINAVAKLCNVVVIDEAHQAQSVRSIPYCCKSISSVGKSWYHYYFTPDDTDDNDAGPRILFSTASPHDAPALMGWFAGDSDSGSLFSARRAATGRSGGSASDGIRNFLRLFSESCFIIRKTPAARKALNLPEARVLEHSCARLEHGDDGVSSSMTTYCERTVSNLVNQYGIRPPVRLRALLAFADYVPESQALCATGLRRAIEGYAAEPNPRIMFLRQDDLDRTKALLTRHGHALPPSLLTPTPTLVSTKGHVPGLCPCCALTESERSLLRSAHNNSLPPKEPPWAQKEAPPKIGRTRGAIFTSVLVRFSDKSQIDAMLSEYPLPDNCLAFELTTAKSAGYRGNLVKTFASHDGQRAKLAVIGRAIARGTCPRALVKIGSIGLGSWFLKTLESYLARRRFLLADATVDVGFDLHRHLDGIMVDGVLASAVEVEQLTGRVSRVAPDIKQAKTVDVIVRTVPGTLDSVLMTHLNTVMSSASSGGSGELAEEEPVAKRARRLLAPDPEALQLFERLSSRDDTCATPRPGGCQ